MKWLIILALFLVLIGIIAYRYRKQIQTGWFMWQAFRKFRQQVKPKQKKQVPKKDTSKDSELTRCPTCSKWTPQEDAVKLKSNYYCSLQCMEESIGVKA